MNQKNHIPEHYTLEAWTLKPGEVDETPDEVRVDARGRPSLYTRSVAAFLLDELASGQFLSRICTRARLVDDNFPAPATVRGWVTEDRDGFSALYARARDIGLDAMAEEMFDIADDGSNDLMTITKGDYEYEIENKEVTRRSVLRVDTRKWFLAKLAPKRYGEKLQLTGDGGGPVKHKVEPITVEEAAAEYARMIAETK